MAYFVNQYSYVSYSSYGYGTQYSRSFTRQLSPCRPILICPPKPKCINVVSTPRKPFRRGDYVAVGGTLVKVRSLRVHCKGTEAKNDSATSTDDLSAKLEASRDRAGETVWKYKDDKGSCKIYQTKIKFVADKK